jgi:hypothetical protein
VRPALIVRPLLVADEKNAQGHVSGSTAMVAMVNGSENCCATAKPSTAEA